jgi:hypothetical protein
MNWLLKNIQEEAARVKVENKATKSKLQNQKAKDLVNKIREVKIHKPGMFAAREFSWDGAIETVAKA